MIFVPSLLLLFFAGCDLFGSKDPESGMVTVEFSNRVNSQDLALNTQNYNSSAGHSFNVTLIEYIITDITLHNKNGAFVSLSDAHYINEEDASTHSVSAVEIPAGTYTSIQFTFGIDNAKNEFGNLERTIDLDNMMWPMMMPMGDGTTERYHYMRFEGRYGVDSVFRMHTGPSGGNDYSFDVELPLDIDIDSQDWTIGISMNLDQWLTNPNEWDFDDYGMIMGNQTAQNQIYDNGHSVFALGFTNTN